MRVEWIPTATSELVDHVTDYAARHDPVTPYRVFDEVRSRAGILSDQPRLGRPAGTREFVVTGTPFILVYQERDGGVRILRVLHGARRWPQREE